MTAPTPPSFDRYAREYSAMHRESIRASGEEPDYFAAYKIAYVSRRVGREMAGTVPTIVDFGCGIGNSIPHIAHLFPTARIRGVDVSGESLELARAANPAATFEMLGADTVPLADASADVVLAACVYHHIPPAERGRWTAEIHRVLRPGGHCFIFEHNPLNPMTLKVVRDCPFDEDAILLRARETRSLLEHAGFTAVNIDYTLFFPRLLSFLRSAEPMLAKLPLGAQYVAHGRK